MCRCAVLRGRHWSAQRRPTQRRLPPRHREAAVIRSAATRSLRVARSRSTLPAASASASWRRPVASTRNSAAARSSATAEIAAVRAGEHGVGDRAHGIDVGVVGRARRPRRRPPPAARRRATSGRPRRCSSGTTAAAGTAPTARRPGSPVRRRATARRACRARCDRPGRRSARRRRSARPAWTTTAAVAAASSAREPASAPPAASIMAVRSACSAGRCGRAVLRPPAVAGPVIPCHGSRIRDRTAPLTGPRRRRSETGHERVPLSVASARSMAPGPTFAATSGLPPRGDLAGRRHTLPTSAGDHEMRRRLSGDGNGWVDLRARASALGPLRRRRPADHRRQPRRPAASGAVDPRGRHLGAARAARATATRTPSSAALREAAEETALDPRPSDRSTSGSTTTAAGPTPPCSPEPLRRRAPARGQRREHRDPVVAHRRGRPTAAAHRVRRRLADPTGAARHLNPARTGTSTTGASGHVRPHRRKDLSWESWTG